jgi:hypothetical protein
MWLLVLKKVTNKRYRRTLELHGRHLRKKLKRRLKKGSQSEWKDIKRIEKSIGVI